MTKKEMGGIPHYLLGIADPKKIFTVAHFKRLADRKIKEIISRGRVPIVAGGTGFYVRAVTQGITAPAVKPNSKLRNELEHKSADELAKILYKLDRRRYQNIDKKNKRRLIRAIEITQALGKVPPLKTSAPQADFKIIGIATNGRELKEAIEKRVKKMIKLGLTEETKKLLRRGINKKRIREFGFEYQETLRYIDGEITKNDLTNLIVKRTVDYAKRQMTWFRRDKGIIWLDDPRKAYAIVRDFLAPSTHP